MKIKTSLLVSCILLGACSSPPERPQSGEPLPPCGSSPNCVSSQESREDFQVAPLAATPQQWQQLVETVRTWDNWSITAEDEYFVQAVAITPLMRYRDDVQLRFDPAAGLVHVRSSSRVGYGDMGANRKRVEKLRAALE